MITSLSSLEKLNNNNYSTWSTRMKFYMLGQDLWEIVGGSETSPPTNQDDLKKWKVRAGKAMYALSVSMEDDLLQRIKNAKTPKEAWDTLAGLFSRSNDAKLQQLENELLSISQQDMTVFLCSNATCGHFYQPRCIAKLLHPEDKVAVEELEKNLASGESFICPIHKCCVCKEGENKKWKELQFAVCRRCPTSYHRKCLPREIVFEKKREEEEEEGKEEEIRAWVDLLPNHSLINCLKHEIIDDLGTPIRNIRFPGMEENKKKQISELPGSSSKVFPKKRRLASEDSFSGKTSVKELKESSFCAKKVASIKRREKMSSASNSSRKLKADDSFKKSLKENAKSASKDVDRSATTNVSKDSLGNRLYEYMTKRSEEVKLGKQDTHTGELDKTMTVKSATKNLTSELPSLDADTERRKHEIIDDLGTPIRNIRFPVMEVNKKKQISELPGSSSKIFPKKRRLASEDSFSGKTSVKELKESSFCAKKVASIKRSENFSSASNSSRKLKADDSFKKSLKEIAKSASKDVDTSATTNVNKDSLGNRLYEYMTKRSEEVKLGKQDTHTGELDKTMTVKSATKNLTSELPSLDADTERRLLALMKDAASSITMEYVMKKHEVPSTHAYSSKTVVDKTITAGKVEVAVEAVRTALKKLENGCSTEDAKAVCEPKVLRQVFKWKNKLKVYLAPFLHGRRYTSFGRHFTKPEKLKEIANILHWYVQDGDMIVDFCCGANNFSWQMKEKLEETGKKCLYKNYDVIRPKNDFNFEKRDWMTVRPNELPKKGSQLIMGLNPPFGVKAALANKFTEKALEFKPKLLILIVPPEAERLDKKNPPYDLVWEDDQCMSGKSFYLPGSVDENDEQLEQWNVTAPPLYLWSRRDWSVKHKAIAQKHGHVSRQPGGSPLEKNRDETKIHDHPAEVDCYNIDASELADDHLQNKEPNKPNRDGDRENQDSHGLERRKSKGTSRKRKHGKDKPGRGMNEKLPENRQNGGKPPGSDIHKGMPHRSPPSAVNGRSSQEGLRSRSLEMPRQSEFAENNLPNLESVISSSHMPYGSAYHDDLSRKYSMDDIEHSHGIHVFSHANLKDRSAGHFRESAESIGYRSYIMELERESNMLPQGRHYGQDPDFPAQRNYMAGRDSVYGQMGSLSTPYGHLGAAADSSYRMGMSAMQRCAPRLDELNHTRMSNIGPDPSMLNRNGMYDPRPPRLGCHVDSMSFVSGPYQPYAHHNSAGWLNE